MPPRTSPTPSSDVPSSGSAASAAEGSLPRAARRPLWLLLGLLAIAVIVAVVAMLGWDTAIHRADEQTTRAAALQTAADQTTGLQQKVATLQQDLTDARGQEQALQAQLAEAKAALTQAQGKAAEAAAAEQRATVAERVASDAERMRAELQGKLDAALSAAARTAERSAPSQPASNISAATAQSDIAPELPLPGLPPGATPRDYLVAAQQAVREGRTGGAQAALERAETRMLNQASLTRGPAHPASHPGVAEVEHALDQLGDGDTEGVLRTIDGLLTQR